MFKGKTRTGLVSFIPDIEHLKYNFFENNVLNTSIKDLLFNNIPIMKQIR